MSLLISERIQLPDNSELKEGLLSTQAYYGRNNSLLIAHERTSQGHGDLADAVASASFLTSTPPSKPKSQKVHYGGIGCLWVEEEPALPQGINFKIKRV